MTSWAIPAPLAAQAQAAGRRAALVTPQESISYAQLAQEAQRRATFLFGQGLRRGDTVVLRGDDGLEKILWLHGIWWLGAGVLPLGSHVRASEVAAWKDSPGALCWLDMEPELEPPPIEGPWSPRLRLTADASVLPPPTTAASLPAADLALDDVMLWVATSGTTGHPKCVALKMGQLLFSAFGVASRLGHAAEDRWCLTLPLHHVGGLSILWRAVLWGSGVEIALPFETPRVVELLASGAVSLAALVPTMLTRVVAAWPPQTPVDPRLRAVVLGGAATPPQLAEKARELGLPVVLSWGMTESASQVATQWPGSQWEPVHVGPPLPFARISASGGRLSVWGPVMGRTEEYVTGDVGHIEPTGEVVVSGRADDVIISGGENVAPQDVEAVLDAHAAIAESAVVGRPDAHWGQRPVAFLVAHDGVMRPSDAELRAFCRSRLASFKVPVQFVWSASLPKDALGKLRRRALVSSAGGHDGPPRSS